MLSKNIQVFSFELNCIELDTEMLQQPFVYSIDKRDTTSSYHAFDKLQNSREALLRIESQTFWTLLFFEVV